MKIQNHYKFPEFDHRAVPSRQREQHRRSWSPPAPPELALAGAASRKLGNFQTSFLGRITPPSTEALSNKADLAFLPARCRRAGEGLDMIMAAHLQEASIVSAVLAAEDRLNRRLRYGMDASRSSATIGG
jgi:hypothetical protein